MNSKRVTLILLAMLAILAVACGSPAAPATQPTTPPQNEPAATQTGGVVPAGDALPMVDPLSTTGDIITAGSSTVFPLTERLAERFRGEGFSGNLTIDSIGTGAGFERFCVAGETDIANASRAIKAEELASCRSIGREPLEFRVGTDALAIVVNKENDFITDVSLEQLAAIFGAAANWSDVDPAWPNEPILRFTPGTDSGTFDYFVEKVYAKDPAMILSAANLEQSEDDNVLVTGVEGSPYAIGFFGYAYYEAEKDRLNILSVEGVTPSPETVHTAEYPLARPLLIYTTAQIMQDKPQVAAFVNYYLTYVNDEIRSVGYFPADEAALQAARQLWLSANP